MTAKTVASVAPTQPPTQRRLCVVGQVRGFRCLPVLPGTEHCEKHHPDRALHRAAQAREAARASHATWRPDPELEAWATAINWDDEAAIHAFLREVAVRVALKGLTVAQGNVMVRAARERLKGFEKVEKPRPGNVLVRFAPNGTEPSA